MMQLLLHRFLCYYFSYVSKAFLERIMDRAFFFQIRILNSIQVPNTPHLRLDSCNSST